MRFSATSGGKRRQKSLTFSGAKYPAESDLRKAIELAVIQRNRESEMVKVDAVFGAITALYREVHLAGLEHSTRQTDSYLLNSYIEPQFNDVPTRAVTPLAVTRWFGGLRLAPTTKASIRSIMSQCFELASRQVITDNVTGTLCKMRFFGHIVKPAKIFVRSAIPIVTLHESRRATKSLDDMSKRTTQKLHLRIGAWTTDYQTTSRASSNEAYGGRLP